MDSQLTRTIQRILENSLFFSRDNESKKDALLGDNKSSAADVDMKCVRQFDSGGCASAYYILNGSESR